MVQELLREFGGRVERPRTRFQRMVDEALGEPVFLTEADLADVDFDIPDTWQIKLTPAETEQGFTESLITPEGEEVSFADVFDVEGVWMTRAQMEAQQVSLIPEVPELVTPEVFATRDEENIYKEYLRTGGTFGLEAWRMLGAPIRPAETDINTLLDEMRELGRTPETEALLRRLAPGVTEEDIVGLFEPVRELPPKEIPPEEIRRILRIGGVPEEEIEKIVALPRIGLGAITSEGAYISEGWIKDTWDALSLGFHELYHKTKQYFAGVVPVALFPLVEEGEVYKVPGFTEDEARERGWVVTPEQANRLNEANKEKRDKWRQVYAQEDRIYKDWLSKNPELEPKPEYERDLTQNWGLLKDPGYWTYTIAKALPFSLGVLGTTLGVGYATKNPYLAITTGTAFATPVVSQDLYEDLLASGAPEDEAARLSLPIGMVIAAVEAVTDLPLLKAISPTFSLLKRNIQKEVVDQTVRRLLKKGLITFTTIEIVEGLEEVAQGAIQNVTVSFYDENRAVFEDIDETILKTLIATLPLAIFGGGMSMRHVSTEEAAVVSPEDKEGQGWKQDEITGEWYKPEKMVDTFEDNIEISKEAGLTDDQAALQAYNEAAKTPEGEQAIKDFVAKQEEEVVEAVPVTPEAISKLSVKERFDKVDVLQREIEELEVKQTELFNKVKGLKGTERTNVNKEIQTVQNEMQTKALEITELKTPTPIAIPTAEPSITPEELAEREARPPVDEFPLRLTTELAKRQEEIRVERAVPEAPYTGRQVSEMQAELAGLKEFLSTDLVAQARFTIGGRRVDLTHFISLRERAYPDYFTVKEAQALFPGHDFTDLTVKGRVPRDAALDDLTKKFNMTADEIADRVMQITTTKARIRTLEAELKGITPEMIAPEVVEAPPAKPKVEAVPITEQLKVLYSEIETEVKAAQAGLEGLKGDEARVGRETLKGLERELRYVKNTLDSFAKRPDLPEATVLRSTILAWARYKGLPKTQLQEIYSSVAGRRQLRVIRQEHLVEILNKVREARPKRIGGKTVLTQKTENKIQTLKDTLIQDRQLTEKSFNHLVEQLGLRTTEYESATKFITESEAKSLIRAMNDEAVLAEWDIKVEEALARNPDILKVRDSLNARSIRTKEVEFDDKPIRISRGNELRSMRYYVLKLQKELNAPIYDVWQKINMAHLALRQKEQILINKLEQSTPEFKAIVSNEAALHRIENYIASKHKMGPKAPADITTEEIKLANELEAQLFQFRNDVRYARFTEAYAGHSGEVDDIARDIPDAPKRAIRRAADIFEGKGATELRTFLDSQEWGVIRSGYNPLSVVKPRLHLYTAKPTTFAKGHIQTREGTEYTAEDRNIMSRYRSYTKQMLGLTDIAPLIRAFDRVFTEHATKLADYKSVSVVLSRGLNEMKGYREDGGFIIHMMERMYAQVASTVFWRPDLVLRNKFQNFAFNPDYHAGLFLHLANKFMSKERRQWFEVFVAQQRGIEQDYLLYSQKPLPGFDRLTRLAHKTSLYPWSDKSNRAEAYFVRMNKIDRALAQYEKDGDINKLINNSGLRDFEARQQAEALELLALDKVDYGIEGMPVVSGREAFARYNAQQLVNNVHFLYDRAQRAPAEMGAAGKTLGNIMVFSRSWGERLLLQGNKIADPKVSAREKILALRIIIGIIVAGMLAGEAYKRVTGKSHNPYNPLNILSWTPGGLIVGAAEDISNTIYWITEAAQGSEYAMGKIPGLISGVATITLPFYKNIVQAIDALTDKKNIDIEAMRKIRELIDEEYELRGGVHEVERTLLEKFQHALLAGKAKPDTPQEKIADAEEMLGQVIEEEDMPFSIEEPDIYGMRKLNSDFGRILKAIPASDITKANNYSSLAEAWVEKEGYEAIWKTKPNVKLYKINADRSEGDTFEEYYRQWRLPGEERKDYSKAYLGNFSRRDLESLRIYHRLDPAGQEEFLEEHPELKLDLADEWLESHPNANAQLAIWGQTKLYSMDAYNQAKASVIKLDIPDNAIKDFFLPEEVAEVYFKLSDSRRSDVLKSGTTKEIAEMYLEYSELYDAGTKGAYGRGEDYRRSHAELQQWGELNLGWKPLEGRKPSGPGGIRAFEGLLR